LDPVEGGCYELGSWHTHLFMLAKVLFLMRPGRVLELGAGLYSTGILSAYALSDPGVEVLSLENDFNPGWFDRLQWLVRPNCRIEKVDRWDYPAMGEGWDFVFIDHGPESERPLALEYFRDTGAGVVGIHDCNYPERYARILGGFRHVAHDRTHKFVTTIASNMWDVTRWL